MSESETPPEQPQSQKKGQKKGKSLTDEAVDGVAWQGLAVGANVFLRAAILILLARSIGAAEFGIIAAATVLISVAEKLSQIGVARVLVQRLTLTDEDVKSAFAISLYTGLAATAVLFLSASLWSSLFKIDGLVPFIQFLAFTLLLNNLATIPAALLQRDRRFRAMGMVELGSYVFGFGLVALPLAKLGFGTWSLAIAQLVQVTSRAAALFAMRRTPIRLWPSRAAAGGLLNVGSGFSAGQVGNFVATQIDYLIVGRWLGVEALGFYNRAYQFLMLPTQLFGTAVSMVLFPSIASIQDQPDRIARAYLRALGVIAMMTLPVSAVMIILAPELIRFLLGKAWTDMILPFQILITTLLFRTSYKISDAVTLAMGSMYQRAWRQWIYAAAVAGGALVGTRWGIAGVAVGVGAAVILNFLLMLQLAQRVTALGIGPIIRVHLRQFAIAALIALPVWIATEAARHQHFSSVLVLGTGCLVATAAGSIVWFRFRSILGEDGAWLHQMAMARLGSILNRKA